MTYHASSIASLSHDQRAEYLDGLTPQQIYALTYDWSFWARPEQLPPNDRLWSYWIYLAGRGSGKTRAGAEWVRALAEREAGVRIALVAPTRADYRKVMVEGDSGILAISRPDFMPEWQPSNLTLTWPNGTLAQCFSAEEPERLRGPQFHYAWCDELAAWRRVQDTWDMLQFGLRLGESPLCFISTTPKPIKLLKDILQDEATVVTQGSTYDNRANLAETYFTKIIKRYEGTRLGRQELNAEILDDLQGALWTWGMIDASRVKIGDLPADRHGRPDLKRVVIGVDPSGTDDEVGSKQGIVAAGQGHDGRFYVLKDRSCSESPAGWGGRVRELYGELEADLVVAERNYGGDMVKAVIEGMHRVGHRVNIRLTTSSRAKHLRAEPIAALYEQRRVSHVGSFPELEEQMTNFTADGYQGVGSPDRVDALVFALTELAYPGKQIGVVRGVRY